MKRIFLPAVLCMLFAVGLAVSAGAQSIPFGSARWEIRASESRVEEHLGRPSLYLKGGIAVVKDAPFTDTIIEFDIACTGERGFMGAVWRLQDFLNYEEFYLRPHQSGNPDANQYQPVFHGMAAWQLYYGPEYSAPVRYVFNEWMHVKIVVSGTYAEFYIQDMDRPALVVSELKRAVKAGQAGLSVGNFAAAHFSNFSVTPMENPARKGTPKPPAVAPAGTVMSWLVSNRIAGKSLEGKYLLTETDKESLSWKKLASPGGSPISPGCRELMGKKTLCSRV